MARTHSFSGRRRSENCGVLFTAYRIPRHIFIFSISEIERKLRKGAIECIDQLQPVGKMVCASRGHFTATGPCVQDQIQYSLLRAIACLNDSCDGLSDEGRRRPGEERAKFARV